MPKVNKKILALEGEALDAAVKDLGPGSTVTTGEKFVLFTLCLPINSANVERLKSLLDSQEFIETLAQDKRDSGTGAGRTSVGGDTSFTTNNEEENKLVATLATLLLSINGRALQISLLSHWEIVLDVGH